MTVKELINWLEEFDEDLPVVLAEYQSRGTNFAYELDNMNNSAYRDWELEEDIDCVEIVLGSQIGSMRGE